MDIAAAVSLTELRKDIRPPKKLRSSTSPKDTVDLCQTKPSPSNATISKSIEETDKIQGNDVAKASPSSSSFEKLNEIAPAPAPFFYYRDRSEDVDDDPLSPLTAPGRVPNFPATMHAILCDPELKDVIEWMPHGRSWRILNPRELEIRVLSKYFQHNKFSSFIRQTNGWGFRRLTKGVDKHSYYNENFLRGLPHLCKKMKRVGSKSRLSLDPSHEPDFYEINKLHPLPMSGFIDESINFQVSKGFHTRMPVSYGVFDATKPGGNLSLKPKNSALNHQKILEDSRGQTTKCIDDLASTNNNFSRDKESLQSSYSEFNSNILSNSLREISSLHLQAAYRAQMLSELYENKMIKGAIAHSLNKSSSNMLNMTQHQDIYQSSLNSLPADATLSCDPKNISKTK